MNDEIKKVYWRKGEIAKELKVFPCTIGYWERYFGDNFYAKKTDSGVRLYDAKGKQLLEEIYRLAKVEKHTLEGVKEKIQHLL